MATERTEYDRITETGIPDEVALNMVREARSISDRFVTRKREQWRHWEQIYRDFIDEDATYPWKSRFSRPEISSRLEAIVPQMTKGIVGTKPFFDIRGRGGPRDAEEARVVKAILDYDFEMDGFPVKLRDIVRGAAKYGGQIVRTSLREDLEDSFGEVEVDERDEETGLDVPVKRMMPVKRHSFIGPSMETVSIQNVIWCPGYATIKDAPYWGHVEFRTWQEIDANPMFREKLKSIREKARESGGFGTGDDGWAARDLTYQDMNLESVPKILPFKGGEIHRIEVIFYNDPGTGKPWVISVLDGQWVLVNRRNPYWHQKKPYSCFQWEKDDQQVMGRGLPEICESLFYECNEINNQYHDGINIANNPMCKVRGGGAIDFDELVWRPGGIVQWSVDPGDVEWQNPPPLSQDVPVAIEEISRQIGFRSGIGDPLRGAVPEGQPQAATTVLVVQEISNAKLAEIVSLWGDGPLREIMLQFWSNEVQLVKGDEGGAGQERWEKITDLGQDRMPFQPPVPPQVPGMMLAPPPVPEKRPLEDILDSIQLQYDFVFLGSPNMGAKFVQAQQVTEFLNTLHNSPPIVSSPIGQALIVATIAKGMDTMDLRGTDDIKGMLDQLKMSLIQQSMAPPMPVPGQAPAPTSGGQAPPAGPSAPPNEPFTLPPIPGNVPMNLPQMAGVAA